jgi:serine/threonine protein kinase
MKYIHEKHLIYRDVKPDNFLVGLNQKSNQIYIVDMGLAKYYYYKDIKKHITLRTDKGLTGTARYASLNSHNGLELSRRDDLIAIGYVMLYFFLGQLPWQSIAGQSRNQRYENIKKMKQNIPLKILCKDCPMQFQKYMEYVCNLKFEEDPDYNFLIELMLSTARGNQIDLSDNIFDWSLILARKMRKNCMITINNFDKIFRLARQSQNE